MEHSTLQIILDYVWVPIVTGLVVLWSKLTGLDVRTTLIEQADAHHKQQRMEDRLLRDEQRKEIMEKIDSHHTLVMGKLDEVNKRIINGH